MDKIELEVEVSKDPINKLFHGLIRTNEFVRGQKSQFRIRLHNKSETEPFSGKYTAIIQYPGVDPINIMEGTIPLLDPQNDFHIPPGNKHETQIFDIFMEGFAFIKIKVDSEKPFVIIGKDGQPFYKDSIGFYLIDGYHVASPQDIYTLYAVVISSIALVTIAGEKIYHVAKFLMNLFHG